MVILPQSLPYGKNATQYGENMVKISESWQYGDYMTQLADYALDLFTDNTRD